MNNKKDLERIMKQSCTQSNLTEHDITPTVTWNPDTIQFINRQAMKQATKDLAMRTPEEIFKKEVTPRTGRLSSSMRQSILELIREVQQEGFEQGKRSVELSIKTVSESMDAVKKEAFEQGKQAGAAKANGFIVFSLEVNGLKQISLPFDDNEEALSFIETMKSGFKHKESVLFATHVILNGLKQEEE